MNFYQSKLNQIKIALGVDVKMVEAILKDGVTKVETESLEPGSLIYVVDSEGNKGPAPQGMHELEDGTEVYVDANGAIEKIEKPEQEVEIEVNAEEVPAGEDTAEQPTKSEATITKEEMASYVDDMMAKVMMAIEEVAKEVGVVKEEMAKHNTKMEKMSKTPGSAKIATFNNEVSAMDPIEARLEGLRNIRNDINSRTRKF